MPRFAANLSTMFTEHPFLERFEAAVAAGFDAVEYLFPYDEDAGAIRAELDRLGLVQALFNTPPGDWAGGERGLAAAPDRRAEFRQSFEVALDHAVRLRTENLHVMAGLYEGPEATRTYVDNLRFAADRAADRAPDLTLLIEPINSRDMPGYHLAFTEHALGVIGLVGADNLRLQLDLYHTQIMEGDLTQKVDALVSMIGHVQIAGVPDRSEPDQGEVYFEHLFDRLDALGYGGWIGCEYFPRGATLDGLGWFEPFKALTSNAPDGAIGK